MGRGHALMGALVWLAGCAVDARLRRDGIPDPALVVIGTPVCAGWALVPDIDHPDSTVSRSAGPISMGVAALVAGGSRLVHDLTRTPWDRPDSDGHRTVTHTVAGAAVFGAAVAVAGWLGGPWTAAALVFWPAHLGISTVLQSRGQRQHWLGRTVRVRKSVADALLLAVAAAVLTPGSAWWLGVAAGAGMLIHIAGDMLTDGAVPAAWPVVLTDDRGRPRRWKPIGVPRRWRFHTGGPFETTVVHPLLWTLSAAVFLLAAWPVVAPVVAAVTENR